MGVPDFDELCRSRISMDELMISLRKSGCSDISEIAYAILEQDGSVSIIQRAFAKSLTPKDMNIKSSEGGMFRIIIERGVINHNSLSELKKDTTWLDGILKSEGLSSDRVLLLLVDESDNKRIFTTGGEKT